MGGYVSNSWYDHQVESIVENVEVKINWDLKIQTDKEVQHSRPDIVLLDKEKRKCFLIDIANPFDTIIRQEYFRKNKKRRKNIKI